MARIYLAGPLFTPQDRSVLTDLAQRIDALGHRAVLPHQAVTLEPIADAKDARTRQARLVELLEGCDAVVAVLDGVDVDAGTSFELGVAQALNRPILGLRSDLRRGGEHDGVNLMAAGAVGKVVYVATWDAQDVERHLTDFLSGVRVFAGRLVRDGVPRIAKERGHDIRFERVTEERLPAVVKRRIVEAARRLEASDFGLEQEEIAELLELVEALIRARAYDRESLRAIKEGAWRKRGGYEKGFVVDEEPKLS